MAPRLQVIEDAREVTTKDSALADQPAGKLGGYLSMIPVLAAAAIVRQGQQRRAIAAWKAAK